jgi:hypothetical protein
MVYPRGYQRRGLGLPGRQLPRHFGSEALVMNDRGRTIALLAASAFLLAGMLLSGLPASASPPAVQQPRHDPVSSDISPMPGGIGAQATVTETKAVLLALELLLSPIYYYVDLPIIANAAR